MTFAAPIVMQFVEEDLLDLPGADAIRVRHLLTHTSEDVPGAAFRYNGQPRTASNSASISGATSTLPVITTYSPP